MDIKLLISRIFATILIFLPNFLCGNFLPTCKETNEPDKLYAEWVNDTSFPHPSFLNKLAYRKKLKATIQYLQGLRYQKDFGNTKTTWYAGTRRCPSRLNPKQRPALHETSLCPWYLEYEFDSSRYPQHIAQARCRCKNCVLKGVAIRRKIDLTGNEGLPGCSEVKIMTKVVVKGPTEQNSTIPSYCPTFYPVSVACVCKAKAEQARIKR